MWTWQHSGLDCADNPEPGVRFEVRQTMRAIAGQTDTGDPIYVTLPDVTIETTERQLFEAFTPAVVEVAIATVTAIDPAGNRDGC